MRVRSRARALKMSREALRRKEKSRRVAGVGCGGSRGVRPGIEGGGEGVGM